MLLRIARARAVAAPMRGLILFAHGARDPRWAEPLQNLRERLARLAPATPVAIAFLEIMEPDLPTAADQLMAAGCDALCIVPIFLGQGGHVRRDLAALVAALRTRHPGKDIRVAAAVGEDNGVLDALAAYCVVALDQSGAVPAAP
jgi:sirohydrochlorin cobaltochelatase